jgi:Protein of unknown function (DUF4232)
MTLTAHSRRASLTGATLAVAAVLAAGCSSSSSSSSSSSATAGASATATTPASGATAASGITAAASGAAASPSAPAGAAGAAACTTTDLKASTGNGGGGAAGSFYSFIDFTNTSKAPCTLYGYPGVSLTAASGAQIGAAATRNTATAPTLVTLAPGATANAELRMTDPTVYPTGKCQPATSAYLKIYPPNQTQPVQISFKGSTCASSSVKMLAIGVVTPGSLPAS